MNTEFRLKIDSWKRRVDERKRQSKRTFEHAKKLREAFEQFKNDFNIEKEKIIECILYYDKFTEDKDRIEKEEKIINNFLNSIPESAQILEIKDIERILDNELKNFKQEMTCLRDYIAVVKSECVLNQYFFSFYDIPDLIVKKKY